MFGTVRLIILCITFAIFYLLLCRCVKIRPLLSKVISLLLSTSIIILSIYFPIENYLVTFDSPQSVYEYYYLSAPDSINVIPGVECDLVIGTSANKNTFMFAPKTRYGWKIGNGLNLMILVNKTFDNILVQVYKYKDTNDYFILALDTCGGLSDVKDAYDSSFFIIETDTVLTYNKKPLIKYYTNINGFDPDYWIEFNEQTIFPFSSD